MSLSLSADQPEQPADADDGVWLECIECGDTFAPFDDVRYTCDECDGLLEVRYADLPAFDDFEGEGVWRYADALPFESGVSIQEGATPLYEVPRLEDDIGVKTLRIKHEGMNPTGSFKDRGMTVGVRVAEELGVGRLACASTGNTSAALAAYGSRGGMQTLVLLPAGKVAAGKIAQASLHGARILEVDGNFDACLDIVQELAGQGEAYLLNSLNPFRLEGQKTIGLEILEGFLADYDTVPDRIVLPVGNAGNTSALYKAFRELVQAGELEESEVPKLTGVQAEGAAPMVEAIENGATKSGAGTTSRRARPRSVSGTRSTRRKRCPASARPVGPPSRSPTRQSPRPSATSRARDRCRARLGCFRRRPPKTPRRGNCRRRRTRRLSHHRSPAQGSRRRRCGGERTRTRAGRHRRRTRPSSGVTSAGRTARVRRV